MNTAVNEQIAALRKSLQGVTALDPKTRAALSSLQNDVDRALETGDHRSESRSLAERLEKMAVRFENNHPAVGTALRQAIDALAKAGM